jgi:hypothetical protein
MLITDIVNINDVLGKISEKELPVAVTYRLLKIINMIKSDVDFFYKKRTEIYRTHGTLTGDSIKISDENMPKFQEEMKQLTEIDVEVTLPKIKIDDLPIEISLIDLNKIMPILEESD